MKAAQLDRYAKAGRLVVREVPVPEPAANEVLVKVRAADVNPLELLLVAGSVRLIQDYRLPQTLGNECSGVVERVGSKVGKFRPGDAVYTRLPLERIGAFAEYVAVEEAALAKMPAGYAFDVAAAVPLTGLTAWQGLVEVLEAHPGQTLLIPGGSGSFGQMAVPIARALGLRVLVTGNDRARERFLAMGVERYMDYRRENYWEKLSGIDLVIDTLGAGEFEHEFSVLKPGGRLLSLRTAPNGEFARRSGFPWYKRVLFSLAGMKYDRAARRQGKEYRFMFVHADGAQPTGLRRSSNATISLRPSTRTVSRWIGSTTPCGLWPMVRSGERSLFTCKIRIPVKIHEICFSPTGGTRRVAEILSQALANEIVRVDLTAREVDFRSVKLADGDVALIAVPSYSGRVPAVAATRLEMLCGNGARAILVCVYGNRAYEDTLAELRDTATRAGFRVVAAVAAVAEHSIVRQYGAGRPDAADEAVLRNFAVRIRRKIDDADDSEPKIPGHRPYRKAAGTGLIPKATRSCVQCGVCAAKCPVGAIDPADPTRVDKKVCISCMRCVAVCPHKARRVNGLLLALVGRLLKKACSERKSCEVYL